MLVNWLGQLEHDRVLLSLVDMWLIDLWLVYLWLVDMHLVDLLLVDLWLVDLWLIEMQLVDMRLVDLWLVDLWLYGISWSVIGWSVIDWFVIDWYAIGWYAIGWSVIGWSDLRSDCLVCRCTRSTRSDWRNQIVTSSSFGMSWRVSLRRNSVGSSSSPATRSAFRRSVHARAMDQTRLMCHPTPWRSLPRMDRVGTIRELEFWGKSDFTMTAYDLSYIGRCRFKLHLEIWDTLLSVIVYLTQMGWHLNISVTPFDFRTLPHPFVLYAPLTGGNSLSLGLGQLWLSLDPFRLMALWNHLLPSARASFLSSNLSTSLSLLKTCLFSWS